MLFPNRTKYRRIQTGRKNPKKLALRKASRGLVVRNGDFALKATSVARINSRHIEAGRKALTRTVGKLGGYWIKIFPDRPFTRKAAEVPMGKGKGSPEGFFFEVFPGRVLFEASHPDPEVAKEALRKAGSKLPLTTKIVAKDEIH